jgi:hypothetical protein
MTDRTNSLESFITVCCYCYAVRIAGSEDMRNQTWIALESSTLLLNTHISHGYCPECYETIVLPMLEEDAQTTPETPTTFSS